MLATLKSYMTNVAIFTKPLYDLFFVTSLRKTIFIAKEKFFLGQEKIRPFLSHFSDVQ